MIQVHFSACFLLALVLLLLPLEWVGAMVIAASFHELCHIVTLYAFGGTVSKIRVKAGGCMIETLSMGEQEQFFSILAGPLGSFSLLLFCRGAPKIAVCGFLQCLFNLMPVLPLDGGRLLRLLVYRFCPDQSERIMRFVTVSFCLFLDALAVGIALGTSAGGWPVLLALVCNIRFLIKKNTLQSDTNRGTIEGNLLMR